MPGATAHPTMPAEAQLTSTRDNGRHNRLHVAGAGAWGASSTRGAYLFSFGVVLYEMVTGRPPFTGATTAVVFHDILAKTPTMPALLNPEVPAELDRLIIKALEKDRAVRCQTAGEILSDLRRVKRDRDSSRTEPPSVTGPQQAPSLSDRAVGKTVAASAAAASLSDAVVAANLVKRHRVGTALAALAIALAFAGVGYLAFVRQSAPAPALPSSTDLEIVRLTSSGNASRPAISPDGKYVA